MYYNVAVQWNRCYPKIALRSFTHRLAKAIKQIVYICATVARLCLTFCYMFSEGHQDCMLKNA